MFENIDYDYYAFEDEGQWGTNGSTVKGHDIGTTFIYRLEDLPGKTLEVTCWVDEWETDADFFGAKNIKYDDLPEDFWDGLNLAILDENGNIIEEEASSGYPEKDDPNMYYRFLASQIPGVTEESAKDLFKALIKKFQTDLSRILDDLAEDKADPYEYDDEYRREVDADDAAYRSMIQNSYYW